MWRTAGNCGAILPICRALAHGHVDPECVGARVGTSEFSNESWPDIAIPYIGSVGTVLQLNTRTTTLFIQSISARSYAFARRT